MGDLSRRAFISTVASAAIVSQLPNRFARADGAVTDAKSPITAKLKWLEGKPPTLSGTTCTVPWPVGGMQPGATLRVTDEAGTALPAQSWSIAYWPDGSVKWSAHALPAMPSPPPGLTVTPGDVNPPARAILIKDANGQPLEIDTGVITCRIPRGGKMLIESVVRGDKEVLTSGQLICLAQDQVNHDDEGTVKREKYISEVTSAVVEHAGPVRAVVKIDGHHQSTNNKSLLPFVVRLYFYAGSEEIRILHSFIFDGDCEKDFLAGVGVRFSVPMADATYDRHVRFVGQGHGLFAEGVKTLTGLRRDPGAEARKAQVAGTDAHPVNNHLDLIPDWGDFTLSQLCADGFQIRKRTKPGCGWIAAAAGKRSGGSGYVGGVGGGVAFGIRDFWQKFPAQIDIRNAHTNLAQVTLWLYAPDASAMDMRAFHDGLGQDTFAKQRDALDITYEDYEPGYNSPHGIARTSEMKLQILATTPTRQEIVQFADSLRLPPQLVCEPKQFLDANVFGGLWTLPDRSTPTKSLIEDQLAFYLEQYLKEIDQHSWYGFWDYGDFRHTYDTDRHEWRYDVGGFAWDNSELSTDMWLWYAFLRTGRADVYRMAEAMTRHTGEVDVYHLGKFKGLGTRHGVQHWGDSSKQTRISSALFRRPFYYLTADDRVGDLMRDQLSEDQTWMTNDVNRKLGRPPLNLGTRENAYWRAMAWGTLAAAWLTEIERTQDKGLQNKLLASMRSIAAMPLGFFTRDARMNLDTGVVTPNDKEIENEHLTAVFGLPEICAELVRTYPAETSFADIWAMYGEIYNGSRADREKALGAASKNAGLSDSHSRCTAFTAWYRKDAKLAERAWHEWVNGQTFEQRRAQMTIRTVSGPDVLGPIEEASISTNNAAQFSLSTMQNLAFVGQTVEVIG